MWNKDSLKKANSEVEAIRGVRASAKLNGILINNINFNVFYTSKMYYNF